MVATWIARVAKPTGAISMARPKKSDAPDLAERVNLTAAQRRVVDTLMAVC